TEGNCHISLHLKDITNLPLCLRKLKWLLSTCKDGWKAYYKQSVFLAGMGVAFLYTTVLGFNCITIGYPCTRDQRVSAQPAHGGLSHHCTHGHHHVHQAEESLWLGDHRDHIELLSLGMPDALCVFCLCTWQLLAPQHVVPLSGFQRGQFRAEGAACIPPPRPLLPVRSSIRWTNNTVLFDNVPSGSAPDSYISIVLLFLGIITVRIGLWSFDMTVTQLLQETIPESERGMNRVQSSMNYLMDLMHFIMVISVPQPQHFGILVIISVLFITAGHTMYFLYLREAKRKPRPKM
ncbi:Solute carrier family 40 member 1, partial [Acipenser ruthenus]